MTGDTIHVEFEGTPDDYVDFCARQLQRSKVYGRWRLRSLISTGAVAGAVGVFVAAGLLGRRVGAEAFVAAALGALVLSLFGRLYDRGVNRRMRALLVEQYGASMPVRCDIELRPACLWHRQDGVEVAYDWTIIKAVHDTAHGVELWLDWGPVLVTNRAFPTASDRERFVLRASELILASRNTAGRAIVNADGDRRHGDEVV